MPKVLLVEDDEDVLSRLEQFLKLERYTVESVMNGSDAIDRLKLCKYDLIVLDWHLPDTTGIDICQEFRAVGGVTPILMLTGRSKGVDKATGLDAGADDYLTKPFELIELGARIRALLRRPQEVKNNMLLAGKVVLNTVSQEVAVDGKVVPLLPLEYSLLEFLLRNPNRVFSHSELVDKVWKSDSIATAEAVRTCVMTLRKKISVPGERTIVKTIHGVGYKLEV